MIKLILAQMIGIEKDTMECKVYALWKLCGRWYQDISGKRVMVLKESKINLGFTGDFKYRESASVKEEQ